MTGGSWLFIRSLSVELRRRLGMKGLSTRSTLGRRVKYPTVKEPGWPHGNRPPATLMWEVWNTERIMSCEINAHPFGFETRCYFGDNFHYSRVHPVRFAAEEE